MRSPESTQDIARSNPCAPPFLNLLRFVGHQHWIRRGLRTRLIRYFCRADGHTARSFERPFFGLTYSGDLQSHIDWHVFFFGAYERAELLFIEQLVTRLGIRTILDVGANIGHHTLFFSRIADTVEAFEPYPPVRDVLEERLAANHIANVRVHAFGLGASSAELEYFAPGARNAGTGSFVADHAADNNSPAGLLTVRRGDEVTRETGIKPDLIKLDVEGFERAALEGLRDTLREHRPVIVMEFSRDTRQSMVSEEEFRALFPAGYRFFQIEVDKPRLMVFNRHRARLRAFEFSASRFDLLVIPAEKAGQLTAFTTPG